MAPLMAGLHGTPQPPFSVLRGDMTFRTEYVTRFASTWHLDDYTFGHLPAFYPPAWFWLAGRTAHVLGIEPWRIVKPFTIGTIGAALAVAYLLWRRVLTPAGALAAAIGSSLVLTRQIGSLGPPPTRRRAGTRRTRASSPSPGRLAGGHAARRPRGRARGAPGPCWCSPARVLALCYYLLFIILALVLAVLARRAERRAAAGARCGCSACCGGVAALTAVFWVPLVVSVARRRRGAGPLPRARLPAGRRSASTGPPSWSC